MPLIGGLINLRKRSSIRLIHLAIRESQLHGCVFCIQKPGCQLIFSQVSEAKRVGDQVLASQIDGQQRNLVRKDLGDESMFVEQRLYATYIYFADEAFNAKYTIAVF